MMLGKMMRVSMGGAVLAGGMVAAGGAAEAAAPCAVGVWSLTSTKHTLTLNTRGDGSTAGITGGAGTRLTVSAKKLVFDFNASKKVVTKTFYPDATYVGHNRYRKKLTLKSSLTGNRKGTLTAFRKSASGNATLSVKLVSPEQQDFGTGLLAPIVRRNDDDFLTGIGKYTYTCTKKTLTITAKRPRYTIYDGKVELTNVSLKYAYKRL